MTLYDCGIVLDYDYNFVIHVYLTNKLTNLLNTISQKSMLYYHKRIISRKLYNNEEISNSSNIDNKFL